MLSGFPLFSTKGPFLSVDDEAILHRMLKRVAVGREIHCFEQIPEFVAEIEAQGKLQDEAVAALGKIIKRWRDDGEPLASGVANFWNQEAFASMVPAVMVDYRMPKLKGVEVLQLPELAHWRGGKIMLTAHADDTVGVKAHNDGLISMFVHKGLLADDPDEFLRIIDRAAFHGNEALNRTWGAQVSTEQQLCLDECHEPLNAFLKHHGWVCHAVLGKPFGILGKTKEGVLQWLQLETPESIPSLVDMLEDMEFDTATIEAVKAGQVLISTEIGRVDKAPKPVINLGTGEHELLGAVFDLRA